MSRHYRSILNVQSTPLLLDLYPAEVAFSLRKLKSTTTNVIRVRRSGDNAEIDVDADYITNGSLASWVVSGGGTQNGFVVKIYNQGSGGATNDASQVSAGSQPYIVKSGVLVTLNGKPSIQFDNVSQGSPMPFTSQTYKTFFGVAKVDTQNDINYLLGNESPQSGVFWNGSFVGVNGIGSYDGSNLKSLNGEDLNQHLGYLNMRSSKLYASKDGASETDLGAFNTSLTSNFLGGRIAFNTIYFFGKFQEVLLYNSDQSGNKNAIETDINTYYGIY